MGLGVLFGGAKTQNPPVATGLVCMPTSGENVPISDEEERVQSVSYPHIRSFSGLYI